MGPAIWHIHRVRFGLRMAGTQKQLRQAAYSEHQMNSAVGMRERNPEPTVP